MPGTYMYLLDTEKIEGTGRGVGAKGDRCSVGLGH